MPESAPFVAPPGVPIVGQPVRIDAISVTVAFTCKCEAQQPLMIALTNVTEAGQGTLTVTCPKCQKTWGFGPGTGVHVNIMGIVPLPATGRN